MANKYEYTMIDEEEQQMFLDLDHYHMKWLQVQSAIQYLESSPCAVPFYKERD